MNVKSHAFKRQLVLLASVVVLSTAGFAQVTIPNKLAGTWTSPDGMFSQSISASFDPSGTKGTLSVWTNMAQCNITSAAIAVTVDGDKLTLKVDPAYVNPCRSEVSVTLTKKSGADEYVGELRQKGGRYDVLQVKMSP